MFLWEGLNDIQQQMGFSKVVACLCLYVFVADVRSCSLYSTVVKPLAPAEGLRDLVVLRAKAESHDLQLTHHTAAISLCLYPCGICFSV